MAYQSRADTIRTAAHRLIVHQDGWVELHDHTADEKGTHNIAGQHPEIVEPLKKTLDQRLALKAGQKQ